VEDSALGHRFQKFAIGIFIHQAVEFGGIGKFDFQKPTLARGIFVDQSGRLGKRAVDFDDCARHRHIDFGGCLDAFDGGGLGTLRQALPYGWKLDKNDIAQLGLRKIGDSDDARFAFDRIYSWLLV